jgi:protein phosphatase
MTGPPLHFETGAVTHVGCVRTVNEDNLFTNEEFGIWLVADGMGGHQDGKLASTIIVEEAKSVGRPASAPDLLSRFNDRIARANSQLIRMSRSDGSDFIGSTVAALLVFGRQFACVWAGDSRIYLVRSGSIRQVSRDHTEVQELVDSGVLKPSEARSWPRRNVITRALGVDDDPGLEIVQGQLQDGDAFVICSDGLTGHVDDNEILQTVLAMPAQEASNALLHLALDRGGKDNVTVIVVSVRRDEKTTILHHFEPDRHVKQP